MYAYSCWESMMDDRPDRTGDCANRAMDDVPNHLYQYNNNKEKNKRKCINIRQMKLSGLSKCYSGDWQLDFLSCNSLQQSTLFYSCLYSDLRKLVGLKTNNYYILRVFLSIRFRLSRFIRVYIGWLIHYIVMIVHRCHCVWCVLSWVELSIREISISCMLFCCCGS